MNKKSSKSFEYDELKEEKFLINEKEITTDSIQIKPKILRRQPNTLGTMRTMERAIENEENYYLHSDEEKDDEKEKKIVIKIPSFKNRTSLKEDVEIVFLNSLDGDNEFNSISKSLTPVIDLI